MSEFEEKYCTVSYREISDIAVSNFVCKQLIFYIIGHGFYMKNMSVIIKYYVLSGLYKLASLT